jgi:periplasmic divalent cation tolerance protein
MGQGSISLLAQLGELSDCCAMFIAWTTLPSRAEAERLAAAVIAQNLAACVQIDASIVSHYRWEGKTVAAEEFRVAFKCLAEDLPKLEVFVLSHHPYETPEWLAVAADRVGEKYLSWAKANHNNQPL